MDVVRQATTAGHSPPHIGVDTLAGVHHFSGSWLDAEKTGKGEIRVAVRAPPVLWGSSVGKIPLTSVSKHSFVPVQEEISVFAWFQHGTNSSEHVCATTFLDLQLPGLLQVRVCLEEVNALIDAGTCTVVYVWSGRTGQTLSTTTPAMQLPRGCRAVVVAPALPSTWHVHAGIELEEGVLGFSDNITAKPPIWSMQSLLNRHLKGQQ